MEMSGGLPNVATGTMRLSGLMLCLYAAPRVQVFVSAGNN